MGSQFKCCPISHICFIFDLPTIKLIDYMRGIVYDEGDGYFYTLIVT